MTSRVAELWNQLTLTEQDNFAHAARSVLAERGTEFVVAIAREARLYTSGSLALQRAQAALAGDPFPALMPPEVAAAVLDGLCHDCRQAEATLKRWDFGASELVELCERCYIARVPSREGP